MKQAFANNPRTCAAAGRAETGSRIEPYGLEIVLQQAALARQRLPQWADRIAIGNALEWVREGRFDFVRTGLEYVPTRHTARAGALARGVAPGGRRSSWLASGG